MRGILPSPEASAPTPSGRERRLKRGSKRLEAERQLPAATRPFRPLSRLSPFIQSGRSIRRVLWAASVKVIGRPGYRRLGWIGHTRTLSSSSPQGTERLAVFAGLVSNDASQMCHHVYDEVALHRELHDDQDRLHPAFFGCPIGPTVPRTPPSAGHLLSEGPTCEIRHQTRNKEDESMESRDPSRTAILTAMHRAAHCLLDDAPKILADHFARPFAGFASDDELLATLDTLALLDFSGHRALFAMKNRYAEDMLAAAVQRGISQYVILGAGLDSYAYRRPDAMCALRVYEVDHPSSQAWKRARVAQLGIERPPTLHYVPLDFEHETLTDGLAAGGVDGKAKTFFSWLGVTQYLTRDAVLNTLREIVSATASGSEVVVTFVVPLATLNQKDGDLLTALAARMASAGEPWLSFFEPDEMDALMKRTGFRDIVHFGPEQAAGTYLFGRTDDLRLPAYFGSINARVA